MLTLICSCCLIMTRKRLALEAEVAMEGATYEEVLFALIVFFWLK